MSREVTTAVTGLSFLECPRWHEGRIWFVDFYTHRVLSAAEDGGDLREEAHVPQQPSGLGWLPDGRLLVISMRDRRLLRREHDGSLSTHADLSQLATGHLNDMVVDARGGAYVGNFGFDLMGGAPLETAALIRVEPDGTASVAAEGLWFPNGCAITEGGELLVDETFGNRVSSFDIGEDGSLGDRRTWAEFGELPAERELGAVTGQLVVAPDGCGLDAEGALWIADAVGNRVLRVRPGGAVVDEIPVGTGAFACMLGGADGRTLYICAAPDFDEHARSNAREADLLTARVDVPHAGRP